jgi:aminopeptidase N
LSEGFATYFTLLFIEHEYGRDEFLEGLRSSAERVWTFYRDNHDYRIVHDNLTDMGQVTSSQTYQKGAWVLHMLRGLVGNDAFWRGIQAYYGDYKDANATTADFQRAMEEASGRDLGWFFQQWLYQGGALILDGGWRYDTGQRQLTMRLNQVQNGPYLFRMPIDVAIYVDGEDAPRLEQVTVAARENVFTLDLDVEPERVVLDPNTRVLMEADFARLGN